MSSLRTPYLLTEEMQQEFYAAVVCNRLANARFWGLWADHRDEPGANLDFEFVGMGGIENIQWENGIGEIGVIINPNAYGNGYGREAVDLLLDQAFNFLNLANVFGECYECSPAIEFWRKFCSERKTYITMLPFRKFWKGEYHHSMYFNFSRGADIVGKEI